MNGLIEVFDRCQAVKQPAGYPVQYWWTPLKRHETLQVSSTVHTDLFLELDVFKALAGLAAFQQIVGQGRKDMLHRLKGDFFYLL